MYQHQRRCCTSRSYIFLTNYPSITGIFTLMTRGFTTLCTYLFTQWAVLCNLPKIRAKLFPLFFPVPMSHPNLRPAPTTLFRVCDITIHFNWSILFLCCFLMPCPSPDSSFVHGKPFVLQTPAFSLFVLSISLFILPSSPPFVIQATHTLPIYSISTLSMRFVCLTKPFYKSFSISFKSNSKSCFWRTSL